MDNEPKRLPAQTFANTRTLDTTMSLPRRWNREAVAVPCRIAALDQTDNPAHGRILNLSPGGLLLRTDRCFPPNQRVLITLNHDHDVILFEFSGTLTGTVRWSQAAAAHSPHSFHVGVAFEHVLPSLLILTEH